MRGRLDGSFNPWTEYPVRMGIDYSGGYKFKGLIGEIRILNRVMSEEEVINSYSSNLNKYKED